MLNMFPFLCGLSKNHGVLLRLKVKGRLILPKQARDCDWTLPSFLTVKMPRAASPWIDLNPEFRLGFIL